MPKSCACAISVDWYQKSYIDEIRLPLLYIEPHEFLTWITMKAQGNRKLNFAHTLQCHIFWTEWQTIGGVSFSADLLVQVCPNWSSIQSPLPRQHSRVGPRKVKMIVATCSLTPMWVMVIECLWDTFWPDPSKDLRFRRLWLQGGGNWDLKTTRMVRLG